MTTLPGPDYYTYSGTQPWDIWHTWDLPPMLANITKYLCRAGRKTEGASARQDLDKAARFAAGARHYFDRYHCGDPSIYLWRPSRTPPTPGDVQTVADAWDLCPHGREALDVIRRLIKVHGWQAVCGGLLDRLVYLCATMRDACPPPAPVWYIDARSPTDAVLRIGPYPTRADAHTALSRIGSWENYTHRIVSE